MLAGFRPIYWREGALCSPAVFAILITGFGCGYPRLSLVAAGAAISVGFGAGRLFRAERLGAMVLATITMALAAAAGSVVASQSWLYLALCGLLAGLVAALAVRDGEAWWVLTQAAIAFLVAGYFPSDFLDALLRALIIGMGGLTQIAIVWWLSRLVPVLGEPLPSQALVAVPSDRSFRLVIARSALAVPLALVLAHHIDPHNYYWAPMTTLMVLKPGMKETTWRGVSRMAGTALGCLVASAIAIWSDNSPGFMIPLIGLAAFAAFSFQRAHYAISTFATTWAAVMLLDLGQGQAEANAGHRIIATLIGGAVALAITELGARTLRKDARGT
ncbi:MAG: FUSC family protein [Proteobacteria bacterium]|nr:FUSC family protein [Pseudomonadota bacterium]